MLPEGWMSSVCLVEVEIFYPTTCYLLYMTAVVHQWMPAASQLNHTILYVCASDFHIFFDGLLL